MKNLYLIPTDKPSRLYEDVDSDLQLGYDFTIRRGMLQNQHIYITNSEEIKEGDYYITILDNEVYKATKETQNIMSVANLVRSTSYKNTHFKIILTTDQDLIKNGVQKIDDEFLEWFVKNPSCEEVEVKKGFADGADYGYNFLDYKIIIPKEENSIEAKQRAKNYMSLKGALEPKQETLEEAAEKYANELPEPYNYGINSDKKKGFIEGAKWQEERSYSEEEVLEIVSNCDGSISQAKKWLEQFKNKQNCLQIK